METKPVRFVIWPVLLLISVAPAVAASSQAGGATLSGTVSGPSGAAVASAKVSVRNVATGESTEAQSGSSGAYQISGLVAGDCAISVTAEGLSGKTVAATVSAGATQAVDIALSAEPGQHEAEAQQKPTTSGAVQAPSGNPPPLSLGDLGISPAETKGNPEEQARLDKRAHMLKIHQRLGLITTAPLAATLVSSFSAGRRSSSSGRDLHEVLGLATTDLYFTTAYFAIRAPKIAGTKTEGPIRVHKILAWIHGPGMILTPILGGIAISQENRGEKVHGIAKAHSAVAAVTAAAFGAAIISVSFKF